MLSRKTTKAALAVAARMPSIPIYTTNAIESLHSQLRKIIKTRGHFPSDDAATKLIWLALRIGHNGGRSVREWRDAMNQFAIAYSDRFTRMDA
jgi:transposase-like protein